MAQADDTRRLAAILAADVVGYSRLMGDDESATLADMKAHLGELVEPAIAAHHGRIVKTTGDGVLAEFASVVDAVQCSIEVQSAMPGHNAGVAEERRIEFCIGINLGDVIVEGEDIYGDGVNVAARLEGLAQPGGVCISRAARDQVRDKLSLELEDLGEQTVKNIARPVRAFNVRLAPPAPPPAEDTPDLPDKPSIAVLPFDNMSGDPEQEYFSDGIAEDIITDLSKVSGLFVIARNSSFAYKGKSPKRLLPLLPVTPDVDRPSTFQARFLDRAWRCAGAFGLGEVGFECCQAGWRAGIRPRLRRIGGRAVAGARPAGISRVVRRCRGSRRQARAAEQGVEGRCGVAAAVPAEHELVEIAAQMGAAQAMEGSERPALQVRNTRWIQISTRWAGVAPTTLGWWSWSGRPG